MIKFNVQSLSSRVGFDALSEGDSFTYKRKHYLKVKGSNGANAVCLESPVRLVRFAEWNTVKKCHLEIRSYPASKLRVRSVVNSAESQE